MTITTASGAVAPRAASAGSRLDFDDGTFRAAYDDLMALHREVLETRISIERRAAANSTPLLCEVPAVHEAHDATVRALTHGEHSVTRALHAVDHHLRATLDALRGAYIAYHRTDTAASGDLAVQHALLQDDPPAVAGQPVSGPARLAID